MTLMCKEEQSTTLARLRPIRPCRARRDRAARRRPEIGRKKKQRAAEWDKVSAAVIGKLVTDIQLLGKYHACCAVRQVIAHEFAKARQSKARQGV